MVKILFVSDREEKIKEYNTFFSRNTYDIFTSVDETYICDLVEVDAPDIIIIDTQSKSVNFKSLNKRIKSISENAVIILLTSNDVVEKDLIKFANAFITEDMSQNLVLSTININLRMKNSLDLLSDTNKDLADSLYRLNALYSTSSQFAGTLDKAKLLNFMVEGMDKSLSFSLTCTLSFCTEDEPVLILNSLYEISDELLTAIKLRTILNYKSI